MGLEITKAPTEHTPNALETWIHSQTQIYMSQRHIYTLSEFSSDLSTAPSDHITDPTHNTTTLADVLRTCAASLIFALSLGSLLIHGIMLATAHGSAIASGLHASSYAIGCTLAQPVSRLLGVRSSVIIGALLSSGGMLAGGFAHTTPELGLALGVFVGGGSALSCASAFITASRRASRMQPGSSSSGASSWVVACGGVGGCVCAGAAWAVADSAGVLKWGAVAVFVGKAVGVSCIGPSQVDADSKCTSKEAVCGNAAAAAIALTEEKPAAGVRRRAARLGRSLCELLADPVYVCTLAGAAAYAMTAVASVAFVPGVAHELGASAECAAIVACAGVSAGAIVARALDRWSGLQTVDAVARFVVCAAIWGLWVPAASFRLLVYVFAAVNGLAIGVCGVPFPRAVAGSLAAHRRSLLATNVVCVACAGAMVVGAAVVEVVGGGVYEHVAVLYGCSALVSLVLAVALKDM